MTYTIAEPCIDVKDRACVDASIEATLLALAPA